MRIKRREGVAQGIQRQLKFDGQGEATIKVFQKTPSDKLHTLTLDNGKESSGFKNIEDKLNIDVYFADP